MYDGVPFLCIKKKLALISVTQEYFTYQLICLSCVRSGKMYVKNNPNV